MKMHTFSADGIIKPSTNNVGANEPINHVEYEILDYRRGGSKVVASDFSPYGSNRWSRSFAARDFGAINMMLSTMMLVEGPDGNYYKSGIIRRYEDTLSRDTILASKGTMFCQKVFHSLWIGIDPNRKDEFNTVVNAGLSEISSLPDGTYSLRVEIHYSVSTSSSKLIVKTVHDTGDAIERISWCPVPAGDYKLALSSIIGKNFSAAQAEMYRDTATTNPNDALEGVTWTPDRLHSPLFSYIVSSGDDDNVYHVSALFGRTQVTTTSTSLIQFDNKAGHYYSENVDKLKVALANGNCVNHMLTADNLLGATLYTDSEVASYVKL